MYPGTRENQIQSNLLLTPSHRHHHSGGAAEPQQSSGFSLAREKADSFVPSLLSVCGGRGGSGLGKQGSSCLVLAEETRGVQLPGKLLLEFSAWNCWKTTRCQHCPKPCPADMKWEGAQELSCMQPSARPPLGAGALHLYSCAAAKSSLSWRLRGERWEGDDLVSNISICSSELQSWL